MCFFSKPPTPKVQKPPVVVAPPDRNNQESVSAAEDERRKTRMRASLASTSLSGPLGDTAYGGQIARAVTLGAA